MSSQEPEAGVVCRVRGGVGMHTSGAGVQRWDWSPGPFNFGADEGESGDAWRLASWF